MITISNAKFKAEIDEQGAQLTHLYNLEGHFDYMWNNDIWPKHAPILFPAIGRSNEDAYLYEGQRYEMPQHGFAEDLLFTISKKSEDSVTMILRDSKTTMKYYPFAFTLSITFSVNNEGLHLSFDVKNDNDKEMSFALGSHPAFNVPINNEGSFDDYQVELTPLMDQLNYWEIIKTPNPYRTGELKPMPGADGSIIKLNHDNFEDGLLIIENDGLKSVKLSSPETEHSIEISLDDFRYLCLWTKEGANAPFLCIEPFDGLPDVNGGLRELESKEGNLKLPARATRLIQYQMTLK